MILLLPFCVLIAVAFYTPTLSFVITSGIGVFFCIVAAMVTQVCVHVYSFLLGLFAKSRTQGDAPDVALKQD